MAITVTLRTATRQDAPALAALEELAFTKPNWSAEIFMHYDCTVAEIEGEIAGFLVSRQIFAGHENELPEREILNLAVSPTHRRTGLATQLLQHELRRHATFFLEVRESNAAARSLYERLGFLEVLRRNDYYDHPRETAVVMRCAEAVNLTRGS